MTTPATLDTQAARTLTDRIKIAVEGTWLLIQDAYTSRAWASLGYDNWDAYCTAEFGASRLRLPREERQEVVASLRESGLSVRAIASATGVNRETIRQDVAAVRGDNFLSPAEVVGTDGKSYAATRPQAPAEPVDEFAGSEWLESDEDAIPGQSHVLDHTDLETVAPIVAVSPEPPKAKRRPLPEAFADATRDLKRAAEQLGRLTQDDRFARNRDQAHHQMPDLLGALEHTAALLQAMGLAGTAAGEEARRWWATSLNTISDALTGIAQTVQTEDSNA